MLAAIRSLDEDFEVGKLSEDDHREMRETLRAEAVELLRAERTALAQTEPVETAPRACPRCAAEAGPEARFCSQCGSPLDASDGEATRE